MAESVVLPRGVPSIAALPPLIPDLSVLLSPWGTWLTQRLSDCAAVWLPRALVMLLDGDGAPLDTCAENNLGSVIAMWNRCWPELVQRPRVHWFSDALDMSHAPKGDSAALLDRLDALIATLDRKAGPSLGENELDCDRLMMDGARDALALAATLPGEPAVVLSSPRHGETEPWACRALDRHGLTAHRLSDEGLREILAGRLLRGFAAAGLAPLLGSGVLRVAAVHLAAAGTALPLPSPRAAPGQPLHGEPSEEELASLFEETQDAALWNDTVAIWYEVP
jgi:hypothetical protein